MTPPANSPVASPAPRRRRGRRWHRWLLGALATPITLLIAAVALLPGCMPGPRSTPAQIAALPRSALDAGNGHTISYLHAGDPDAPRVIFIHGSPGAADAFADYLVEPPPGTEAISVDRLGFGHSVPTGVAVVSLAEQADALRPLLVQRHGRWPILVGHSLGGPIAARLAADAPDRVGGVLILAGSLDPQFEQPRWYNDMLTWAVVRWIAPRPMLTSNAEMMAGAAQTRALAGVLGNVRCRVILLHGTEDPLVPFGNTAYAKRMLTGAASVEVVSIPGEGHFLPWKQEAAIRRELGKLTGTPATTAATPRAVSSPP